MGLNLREKYDKAVKSKNLEKFYKYLSENNLIKEFITENCFRESDENLSYFALKASMELLREAYGENLANRFGDIIYNEQYSIKRNMDISYLIRTLPKTPISEKEAVEIGKVLDIASQEDYVIGTHITGGEIGGIIEKQGILLTGHKFAGEDKDKNIEQKLEKNITLFKQSDPIFTMLQMISGRKYNNRGGKYNDIIMVSIPKKELERNNPQIIINDEKGVEFLNPKYIAGYVKIEAENGRIEGVYESTNSTKQKNEELESREQFTRWTNELDEWYRGYSSKPNNIKNKFEELMLKIKNIFGKTKQLPQPSDETPKINAAQQYRENLKNTTQQMMLNTQEQGRNMESDRKVSKTRNDSER